MSDKMQNTTGSLSAINRIPGSTVISSGRSISSIEGTSKRTGRYHLSSQMSQVMESIRRLEVNDTSTGSSIFEQRNTLEEKLFDARANVKILLSQVSMHFSDSLRKKLYQQLDLLHDPADWEEGDQPIRVKSFRTLLRWFYLNQKARLPSFGLSNDGHIIASWLANKNRDRLILEYLPDDRIRWFVTKHYESDLDQGAGVTSISRVRDLLMPYKVDAWLAAVSQPCT